MRLAEFILREPAVLLPDWEEHVRGLRPAPDPADAAGLRERALDLLRAIAADLRRPASSGPGAHDAAWPPRRPGAVGAAAHAFALARGRSTIDLRGMCIELRLLRTGILRGWRATCAPGADAVDEVLQLDDAFDEALAEGVCVLEAQHEDTRNLLLGALGHDLRNPLNAIHAIAAHLALLPAGQEVADAARRLGNSSLRMKVLLDDLLDYNRATLGGGLHVEPAQIDLAQAAEEELQQLRTTHPGRAIELTAEGDTRGHWDPNRMQQLLGNLVSNAIKYGDPTPVRVRVAGRADGALLEVRNRGPGMTQAELARIFEPLRRGSTSQARPESTSLGLGLYIAREIVRAHGGRIEASHALGETVFEVSLPRHANAAHAA